MARIISKIFANQPSGPFTVAFDLADASSKGYHRYPRRLVIGTPLGLVELEPLAVGYDAVFGMCSVFQPETSAVPFLGPAKSH